MWHRDNVSVFTSALIICALYRLAIKRVDGEEIVDMEFSKKGISSEQIDNK